MRGFTPLPFSIWKLRKEKFLFFFVYRKTPKTRMNGTLTVDWSRVTTREASIECVDETICILQQSHLAHLKLRSVFDACKY